MRIEMKALLRELPALAGTDLKTLCELLASLGFPVDAVETDGGTSVLEVDVTANRGDALSHRGLARDLAARLAAPLADLDLEPLPEGGPLFPVRIESEACALYATAILELGAGPGTPAGIRDFLARMGSSAKDLPAVDASNAILHRLGHPTHAFDADTLEGAVVVRWARSGERLVTLDGVERVLTERDLVIADERKSIGLAGIMGGDGTKVTPATRRVLLESAWFDPRTVRATARRHNLHTDASLRFGRGADPAMAAAARDMLARHLEAWSAARLLGAWTVGSMPAPPAPVAFSRTLLDRVAGERVPEGEARELLLRLGCRFDGDGRVVPPTWRHDLGIPDDLAEEVLRLRGYERIPASLPALEGSPEPLSEDYLKRRRVATALAHQGFCQTVTYGFVDPGEGIEGGIGNDPAHRTLKNPLGEEYSLLRGTLLRDLRAAAVLNLDRGAREVRLFELAPVFVSQPGVRDLPVREQWTLAVVWAGETGGEDPLTPVRNVSAPEGKSHLIGILKALGVPEASLRAFDRWSFDRISGGVRERLGWQFEIPLAEVRTGVDRVIPPFAAFSRFPAVERDLSLLVGPGQTYRALAEALEVAVRESAGAAFQGLTCADVFRHKSLPEGRQAWLVRLRFQHFARTLTREEVDGWVAAGLAAARSLGAELRV